MRYISKNMLKKYNILNIISDEGGGNARGDGALLLSFLNAERTFYVPVITMCHRRV